MKRNLTLEGAKTALLLAVVFAMSLLTTTVNTDSWWQLRAGKEIWDGTFSYRDSWSFTAEGNFWPDHEPGFQLLLYILWLLGGQSLWLIYLAVASSITGAVWLLRPRGNTAVTMGVAISLGVLLTSVLSLSSVRPVFVSFLLFALSIWLVTRKKHLLFPLLMVIWVNFHGSFILGLGVLGLGFCLQLFESRDSLKKNWLALVSYGLTLLASFGVTLLNPLGLELWRFTLNAGQYLDSPIAEWRPFYTSGFMILLFSCLLLMSIIAFGRLKKKLLSWELAIPALISVFMLALSIGSSRYMSYLALSLIPLLWVSFSSNEREKAKESKTVNRLLATGAVLVLTVGLFWSAGDINGMSKNPYPAELQAVLSSKECLNHTWNDYWSGGKMIWWLPEQKVSIDSRYDPYPQELKRSIAIKTEIRGEVYDNTVLLNGYLEEHKINCYFADKLYTTDDEVLASRGVPTLYEDDSYVVFQLPNHEIPEKKAD